METENTAAAADNTGAAPADASTQENTAAEQPAAETGSEDILGGDDAAKKPEGDDAADAGQDANETPEGEEKPDGQDADDTDGEDDAEGAPEEYADFELPEGFITDDEAMAGFQELARDNNLSQDQAQKFLDQHVQMQQRQVEQYQAQVAQWGEDARNDKEIGGEAFEENVAHANRALKEFSNDTFINLLKDTGYANHPEVVRTFVNIGKRLSEGNAKRSSQGAGSSKRAADVWYNKS